MLKNSCLAWMHGNHCRMAVTEGCYEWYIFWMVCYTIEMFIGLFLFEIPSKWKNDSSAPIERRYSRIYEFHHRDKMVVKHLYFNGNPIFVGWHIWYGSEFIPYSRFLFPYFMMKNGKRHAILIHLLFLNRLHNWKVEIRDSDQSECYGKIWSIQWWKCPSPLRRQMIVNHGDCFCAYVVVLKNMDTLIHGGGY